MNKERRKEIEKVVSDLEEIEGRLSAIMESEQEAFDNLPESFQGAENGEKMEGYIENLSNQIDSLQTMKDELQEIIDS